MSDFEGFECLGFKIICDNCDREHILHSADSVKEAKEDAKTRGLVTKDKKHFCNEDCYKESKGEICIHVLVRSGPDSKACIKCGTPRDECYS